MVKKFRFMDSKTSLSDRIFYMLNAGLLIVLFVVIFYPLVYVLSSSFSSAEAVAAGKVVFLPVNPSLEGYREVLQYQKIFTGYFNSIIYTVVGTAIGVVLTCLCAFPLSRSNLYGRKVITLFFIVTIYFSGGLVPTYLLMNQLGFYNTRAAVIFPMILSVFNVLVARTFFAANIPEELYEYAQLDGCSDFKLLVHIVMPLSKTIIAVLTLYYAVRYWNNYYNAFLYLSKAELYPLQLVLREILAMTQRLSAAMESGSMASAEELTKVSSMYELLKFCVIVIASLPIVCLYPFVQRYFVKGVMIGSVKG